MFAAVRVARFRFLGTTTNRATATGFALLISKPALFGIVHANTVIAMVCDRDLLASLPRLRAVTNLSQILSRNQKQLDHFGIAEIAVEAQSVRFSSLNLRNGYGKLGVVTPGVCSSRFRRVWRVAFGCTITAQASFQRG